MTDQELIEAIVDIDEEDESGVRVSDLDFVDTIVKKAAAGNYSLSPDQRKWAQDIVDRHEDGESEDDGDDE